MYVICYRKGLVQLFPHFKGLVLFSASEKSYGSNEWDGPSLGMVICYRKRSVYCLSHNYQLFDVKNGSTWHFYYLEDV